jgi:glycosyltransferase involved in cell wall biosynthesis
MADLTRKLVSYVFPVYNEAGNVDMLFETLTGVVELRVDLDFEFVFVNDGSRDNSLELLTALHERDARVVVVNLSRNFGHQIAVTAGLDASSGEAIIIMDSDLQDPPAVSLELIEKWEEGWDVVYAQRASRKDTLFKRATASAYYRLLRRLADIDIPPNTGDFRLIDRKVVDGLARMGEHNRFLRGMVSFVGYRQIPVQFRRDERHAGVTGYPLSRMIKFASDGILSFSSAPLRLISSTGYLFSALSFVGIVYALVMKIFAPAVTIDGWTFMVISVLLMGGIQMIMLGVLGSYIGRVYTESQGRPLYFVQHELRSPRPGRG